MLYPSDAHRLWAIWGEVCALYEARANELAASVQLSPVAAWALMQLEPEKPISQRELAQRLHCTPSTVVDPTDRLEARGLVKRQTHPTDRRVNVLVVTKEGRKVRDRLLAMMFDPPEALTKASPRDLARFLALLQGVLSSPAARATPAPAPR
jgi:DNA-binding MarR family transcriptional regulator